MQRLETGDVRGAHSRADEAEALYRDAELTSIKAQYLSQTRALLAEADQGRVSRFAPKTYEKARDRCSRKPSGRSTRIATTPICRAASRSRRTTKPGTRSTSRR